VDARSDVYAIGAVGYYLLTGTPVFVGASVVEICMKHVQAPPEPPSARLGGPVSPGLERLLLRCLAKDRADRPADAGVLLAEFEACAVAGTWTRADADAWWQRYSGAVQAPTDPGQTVDAVAADLAERLTVDPELPKSPPEAMAESARETRLVESSKKLFPS
jgi:hypothetical protein